MRTCRKCGGYEECVCKEEEFVDRLNKEAKMTNYTLTILKVLTEWLDEKGWGVDVEGVRIQSWVGTGYKVAVLRQRVNDYAEKYEFKFTQVDLEAVTPPNLHMLSLEDYIRLELERQCDE